MRLESPKSSRHRDAVGREQRAAEVAGKLQVAAVPTAGLLRLLVHVEDRLVPLRLLVRERLQLLLLRQQRLPVRLRLGGELLQPPLRAAQLLAALRLGELGGGGAVAVVEQVRELEDDLVLPLLQLRQLLARRREARRLARRAQGPENPGRAGRWPRPGPTSV